MDEPHIKTRVSGTNQVIGFTDDEISVNQSVLVLFPDCIQKEFVQVIASPPMPKGGMRSIPYDQSATPAVDPDAAAEGFDYLSILSRIDASAGGGRGYVDYAGFWLDIKKTKTVQSGTLLYVPETDFIIFLEELFPRHSMTAAERRVLVQLMCALSLKEAATADCVSYETKRSQFKAVCHKTGFGRQVDLCTFVFARLLLNITEQGSEKQSSHTVIRDYHRRCMPAGVRLHVLVGATGYQHRVFDMGPVDGRAILVLHAQILPWFCTEDIEALYATKIRLIWPMRPGALAPEEPKLSESVHLDVSLQAMQCAVNLLGEEQTVDILGISSGCFYATEFHRRYPTKLNRLFGLGTEHNATPLRGGLGRYQPSLRKKNGGNPATTRLMFYFLVEKCRDREVWAYVLNKMFVGHDSEFTALDRLLSKPGAFDAIQMAFVNSAKSIYQDINIFSYTNECRDLDIKNDKFVHAEFDAVHGSDDKCNPDNVRDTQLNMSVRFLDYYGHLKPMTRLISKFAEG